MTKKFLRASALIVILALMGLMIPWQSTQAASLTNMSDTMSRLEVNTASNHTIKFKTPTGVDSSGDTITITFPAGFDLTSIAYTDIDLSHGASTGYETEETLAATPTSGTWGAAVSGQVLTLTAPTNATSGEITANDYVVIEIGTNASGGVNQIINPSSAETYKIDIGGIFGDSGSLAVVILSHENNEQVVVSATVDPTITFSLSSNTVNLGTPTPTTTGFGSHTFNVATNGTSGFTVTVNGPTLTSGSNTIDAIGATASASSTGTEQFGMNLRANNTPSVGADAVHNAGVGTCDYGTGFGTADEFAFAASTDNTIASSTGTTDCTYTSSYIVNISTITEAGTYSTTLTYIATGKF